MLKSDIPLARFLPAQEDGELGALRVERRDPDARDEDERRGARRSSARRPRGRCPTPARASPAGSSQSAPRRSDQSPKSGCIERRRDEHGEHQDGRERVAEIELDREERQQRRHAPGGEVGREVPTRQHGHALPVDRLAHDASLGIDACTAQLACRDGRHRSRGARQDLPLPQARGARARRRRPRGAGGNGARTARAERRRQDDHGPHSLDAPSRRRRQRAHRRARHRARRAGRAEADRPLGPVRRRRREPDRPREPLDVRPPLPAHARPRPSSVQPSC